MYNFPYLKDSVFLKKFDKLNIKEQFVKIVVLSFDQKPIRQIQGQIQTGSITIDGSSAMRRTANLTVFATDEKNDLTNIENLLSLNKKVQILVGFTNTTDEYKDYPILWFPQGVYAIIAPNISYGSGGVTITLTLHDKMAFLNGECGGTFAASVTFHEVEELNKDGEIQISKPTVFQIIQQMINHFGGEQLGKIIISDIDNRIKRVMKWTGSTPLYLYTRPTQDQSSIYEFSTNYNELLEKQIQYGGTIEQFDFGEDVGFIMDNFTYEEQLIANAGDTIVTILDKIKAYLGNYEYFYDINGNFVFQQIKNYLNTSFSTTQLDQITKQDYLVDYVRGKSVYTFDNADLIISYSNAPQYQQIKNDFVVWGKRKTATDVEYPIRYHLALDSKPEVGRRSYQVFFYEDPQDGLLKAKSPVKFENKSKFPKEGDGYIFYLAEDTGIIYQWNYQEKKYEETDFKTQSITATDFRTELYLDGVEKESLGLDSNYYFTELKNEWTKIYDIEKGEFLPQVEQNPEQIVFFLDIIDSPDMPYSINNIGRRTCAITEDLVNCVFEPSYPDIVFIQTGTPQTAQIRQECIAKNQRYTQVDESLYSMLLNGGGYRSAFEEIKTELYQYTNYNEQITLTVLPIYYLQPNTRITVQNQESGIYGDYIIKSISIPLDINGTMNLTCTRATERI